MEEFEKWLEGLELQTLTDELKESILSQAWLIYDNREMEKSITKHFTLEDMMECWNTALKFKETKTLFSEFIMTKHEQQK